MDERVHTFITSNFAFSPNSFNFWPIGTSYLLVFVVDSRFSPNSIIILCALVYNLRLDRPLKNPAAPQLHLWISHDLVLIWLGFLDLHMNQCVGFGHSCSYVPPRTHCITEIKPFSSISSPINLIYKVATQSYRVFSSISYCCNSLFTLF